MVPISILSTSPYLTPLSFSQYQISKLWSTKGCARCSFAVSSLAVLPWSLTPPPLPLPLLPSCRATRKATRIHHPPFVPRLAHSIQIHSSICFSSQLSPGGHKVAKVSFSFARHCGVHCHHGKNFPFFGLFALLCYVYRPISSACPHFFVLYITYLLNLSSVDWNHFDKSIPLAPRLYHTDL